MNEIWLEIILGVGGILAGFFGLIKYMTKQNNNSQKQFLDHLEKKNGHLERISNEFNETMKEELKENITFRNQSTETHAKIIGMIENVMLHIKRANNIENPLVLTEEEQRIRDKYIKQQ